MLETIEYRTVDKSEWGEGEWQGEPDKVQWEDEATGLPCLIVRNRMGAWCGYVGLSKGHPLYGKSYNDAESIDAHGSLTFADFCHEGDQATWLKWRASMLKRKDSIKEFPNGDAANDWKERGQFVDDYEGWLKNVECNSICHKTEDGQRAWWLGFDCSHSGDLSPKLRSFERKHMPDLEGQGGMWRDTYKNVAYVQNECRELARQLKELAG